MNYITGDTHGNYSHFAYQLQQLPKNSKVFHAGDFGFIWSVKVSFIYTMV